jgi:hypothetical protein
MAKTGRTRRNIRKPAATPRARQSSSAPPSEELRIGVTFPAPQGKPGPVHFGMRLNTASVREFKPEDNHVAQALEVLQRRGFRVTEKSELSASIRGSRKLFEEVFGTSLTTFRLGKELAPNCQARSFYFPHPSAGWDPNPEVAKLIDDAYIQWPHIYFNNRFTPPPSPLPPRVNYHHLRVPGDVSMLVNASAAHRQGVTGRGVRVAMIDSGFAHGHPYFKENDYRTTTVLAAGATEVDRDGNGHGTGESANLLAVAPDVTFTGIKLDNETNPGEGASVLEGFQEALKHNPQVISCSLGYDLCPTNSKGQRTSNKHLDKLPNSLVVLEKEIQAAAAKGIVVVFSAGNGHVSFPGMMREVISAGGVFVAENGAMSASDYASAFDSKIYPGRHVPDVCGLVGQASNGAAYIALPVDPGGELDRLPDGTRKNDGWGVFSGTSAAAPQIAGLCALLLQQNPGLSSDDIRSVLRASARDIVNGSANPASNEDRGGMPAGAGGDGATGAGLVDARAALRLV